MNPTLIKAKTAAVLATLVALAGCGSTATRITATNEPTAAAAPSHHRPLSSTTTATGASASTTSLPPAPTTSVAPSTTTTTSGADNVDRTDATAVAEAMLRANFTANTTTDTTPFDATNRSLVWYTPAEAARVVASAPTGPVGAEWITWTHHKVTTTVAVQINHDPGAPADTATSADRQFNVIVTPHGEDGWSAPPDQYQCFVTLTRLTGSSPWQVANLQTSQ